MQPRMLPTVTAVATTLAISSASLLLAAFVFLKQRNPGEPPAIALLIGVGSFLIGDCSVRCESRTIRKVAAIIIGAIFSWMLLPEVAGRYASKWDELFTMDRLHFGAVSFTIAGGTAGSIVEGLFRSWASSKDSNVVPDV